MIFVFVLLLNKLTCQSVRVRQPREEVCGRSRVNYPQLLLNTMIQYSNPSFVHVVNGGNY